MNFSWALPGEIDRLVHEPARLVILGILAVANRADFALLLKETCLSKGNLSSHLMTLEDAGYISIEKTFKGKVPLTIAQITSTGRKALARYRKTMVRLLAGNAAGATT